MSRIESLPPDLSAALSLLLRQGKRHADVATLLGIQERAVHDRAHAALALLAPAQARALSSEQREEIGEYLLGQQDASGRTRAQLAADPASRAWAQALARELAPLAGRPLPPIPPPAAASSPAQLPISRAGGALVLGAIAAAIVVAILLVVGVGGGGGSHGGSDQNASSTAPGASHSSSGNGAHAGSTTSAAGATSTTGTGTGTETGTSGSGGTSPPNHGKALELTPASPAASGSVGVAYVLNKGSAHAFYVFAKGLPQLASGAFYAVWLEEGAGAADYPLGSLPAAASSGLVEGGGPLPSNAHDYRKIVVTTETSHRPSAPGPAVLGGAFSMH